MESEALKETWFFIVGGVLTMVIIGTFYYFLRKLKHELLAERRSQETPPPAPAARPEPAIVESPETETATEAEVAGLETPTHFDAEEPKTLKEALKHTEMNIFGRIRSLFGGESAKQNLEEIEEILYTSDLGPQTVTLLMEAVTENLSRSERADADLVRQVLKKQFLQILSAAGNPEPINGQSLAHLHLNSRPTVLMIVGVNGAGKTTSIGKIASQLAQSGKKVLVAAGDTFRAAAGNQLKTWTDRAQVEIFSPEGVSDPSAVAFDAVSKAKAQGYDVVIVDTAGRLHTQSNLMEELKKMKRVMSKVLPDAPHETLIVLDANSGQNALMQAREFHKALGLTGAVLTKMDGTAKGGVAVGLSHELKIPIRMIGVGEKITDLRAFSPSEFVDSIL